MKIDSEKIKEFIHDNESHPKNEVQIARETSEYKLEILEKANVHLEIAFFEKNPAMVAAIAEILKAI